jgi:hypothetical protein
VAVKLLSTDHFQVSDIDVYHLSNEEIAERLQKLALELLEPEGGPLVHLTAFHRLDETALLLRFHHVLVDGWAVMVAIRELVQCYMGGNSYRPTTSNNFSDFVQWQKNLVSSDKGRRQLDFWLNYLSDLPLPLRLPYDLKDRGTFKEGDYINRAVSLENADALSQFSKTAGVTLFRLLLAAFNVTIYVMTDTADAPVASAVANRMRRDVLDTIGWIANNVHYRTPIDTKQTARLYCKRVSISTDSVLENQDYPEPLIEQAITHDFPGCPNSLNQLAFGVDMPHFADQTGVANLLFQSGTGPARWGRFSFQSIDLPSVECYRDLTLTVKCRSEKQEQLTIDLSLNYRCDVFLRKTAERILELYETVARAMVDAPDVPLSNISANLRARFPDLVRTLSADV